MSERGPAQDRTIGIVALVLGTVLFYETFSFRVVDWDWMGLPFWPRLLLGFLMALGAYFLVRGSLDAGPFSRLEPRAFLVLAGGVLYVMLIEPVGYLLVTPPFIFAFSYALGHRGRRGVLEAAVTAAVGTAIIYFVFKEALYVQFPEGLLEERL